MVPARHDSLRKTLKEPNSKPQRYLAGYNVTYFAAVASCVGTHDL